MHGYKSYLGDRCIWSINNSIDKICDIEKSCQLHDKEKLYNLSRELKLAALDNAERER